MAVISGWLVWLLMAAAPSLATVEDIRACARGNLPERDSLQSIELVSAGFTPILVYWHTLASSP